MLGKHAHEYDKPKQMYIPSICGHFLHTYHVNYLYRHPGLCANVQRNTRAGIIGI
jgi:hypothetical protein